MEPKTIGPFFWYIYRYLGPAPLLNRKGTCSEVDPPYRHGRSWLLRLPLSSAALVLGRWDGQFEDEDAAITLAMGGRPACIPTEEIREWD